MPVEALSVRIEDMAESLRLALDAVRTFALSHNVPQTALYRVLVALDEVISNIFCHGYEGCSGPVELSVALEGEYLELRVVDRARPFNPLQRASPDLGQAVEHRPIGGLGIHLVRALIDDVEYTRRGENNHLLLRKKVVN